MTGEKRSRRTQVFCRKNWKIMLIVSSPTEKKLRTEKEALKDEFKNLEESLNNHATFLKTSDESQSSRQTAPKVTRKLSGVSVSHNKAPNPVSTKYQLSRDAVLNIAEYTPISLTDLHVATPFKSRMERSRFFNGIALDVPVDVMRFLYILWINTYIFRFCLNVVLMFYWLTGIYPQRNLPSRQKSQKSNVRNNVHSDLFSSAIFQTFNRILSAGSWKLTLRTKFAGTDTSCLENSLFTNYRQIYKTTMQSNIIQPEKTCSKPEKQR